MASDPMTDTQPSATREQHIEQKIEEAIQHIPPFATMGQSYDVIVKCCAKVVRDALASVHPPAVSEESVEELARWMWNSPVSPAYSMDEYMAWSRAILTRYGPPPPAMAHLEIIARGIEPLLRTGNDEDRRCALGLLVKGLAALDHSRAPKEQKT